MKQSRIAGTLMDTCFAMSEGNPGAITALMELMNAAEKCDPLAWAKELQPILGLDDLEIYGSKIWVLYKDICGQDVKNVFTLFRARQLGLVSSEALQVAVSGGRGNPDAFDFVSLLGKIRSQIGQEFCA